MAAALRAAKRFLQVSSKVTPTLSRSAFQAERKDSNNPNWIAVGLSLSSTVLLWVMLPLYMNMTVPQGAILDVLPSWWDAINRQHSSGIIIMNWQNMKGEKQSKVLNANAIAMVEDIL